jgi:hypothetical protein
MSKFIVFLLVAVSAFVSFELSPNVIASKNNPAFVNPSATPKLSAKIERIELDKNEIVVPCPPWMKKYASRVSDSPCYADGETYGLITVKTTVYNPKNKALTYQYTISGGRIVGEGENVVWDLKGLRPGNYTITAAVNEGRGFNDKTPLQTVTIRDSCCCIFCICPTLEVTGGGGVKGGETVEFTANVSGGTAADITYNWTVSQGEIIEGQGTPKIKVKTTPPK